jgi:hypothetical protein
MRMRKKGNKKITGIIETNYKNGSAEFLQRI